MGDSDLREFFAPIMAHCLFAAAISGLLIPPLLLWFAGGPYPRLLTAMRTKAASQPKGSNLRQLVALMPLLLIVGSPCFSLSFMFFLKWYYRAPSIFAFQKMNQDCSGVYVVSLLASFAATLWWLGPEAFRRPGYDPKNPNPDPDEWRWKS
jgi:hypothetical protein